MDYSRVRCALFLPLPCRHGDAVRRYGDIIPDHGPSRDFTIFYLCLSILLIGAVMAISREYQSVVRKKESWDKSQQLAETMRSLRVDPEGAGDTDTQSSSEAGDVPPAPISAPGSVKSRRNTRFGEQLVRLCLC